jgi:uncharacterized integral membrane protein
MMSPQPSEAMRQAALAEALARFSAQRARAAREMTQMRRDAVEEKRAQNGWVMLGIGGLFLVFALVCVGIAVASTISAKRLHSGAFGIGGFGAFWAALGGFLFYIGLRYQRAGARERRLRAQGLAGKASVVSYKLTHVVLDGLPKVALLG